MGERSNHQALPVRNQKRLVCLCAMGAQSCRAGQARHRGVVTAVTIQGEWGYFEYDWNARKGDYVVENPGTIHTLRMGDDAQVAYTVNGSIEFFNDDDSCETPWTCSASSIFSQPLSRGRRSGRRETLLWIPIKARGHARAPQPSLAV